MTDQAAVLDLDDPACLSPIVAGAKAAALARARMAGLPVLPGLVLTAAAARQALTSANARTSVHHARLEAMSASHPLLEVLTERSATLGTRLVVRSSSPFEEDLRWAGVFASYLDVGPDDVTTAVRGVWASALQPGDGQSEPSPDMAILVQPQLQPQVSGTAALRSDDTVVITLVHGHLAGLVNGGDADAVVVVEADQTQTALHGEMDDAGPAVGAANRLVRQVQHVLGRNLVEWASHDGSEVVLLQAKSTPSAPVSVSVSHRPRSRRPTPKLRAAAHLVQRFGGPLGDTLVLPWALAGPAERLLAEVSTSQPSTDPLTRWRQAQVLSRQLSTEVWGSTGVSPKQGLGQLRSELDESILHELKPPQGDTAASLRGMLQQIADHLVANGVLNRHSQFWALDPDLVEPLLSGAQLAPESLRRQHRHRPWEAFVLDVVVNSGEHYTGLPAAPGQAVGRVLDLTADQLPSAGLVDADSVLLTRMPAARLAPLLWSACGLVATAGSPGAHLVEVAHSLGVPAVVRCELGGLAPDSDTLVAIDGTVGAVAVSQLCLKS